VSVYQEIDPVIAVKIRGLHKRHPQLGPDGIGRILGSQGINVDPAELRQFFRKAKLKGDSIGARSARLPAASGWVYGAIYPGSPFGPGLQGSGLGSDIDGGDFSD
jgi:hypothetical protein